MINVLVLAGLLALPVAAGYRLGGYAHWFALYAAGMSTLTYWIYAVDKKRAEKSLWRIPETRLHLLDLSGGWPGGFLAQRRLRHKCSKGSFQFVFWLIVLVYQFAAFDSFQNWQYSRAALKYIEQTSNRRR